MLPIMDGHFADQLLSLWGEPIIREDGTTLTAIRQDTEEAEVSPMENLFRETFTLFFRAEQQGTLRAGHVVTIDGDPWFVASLGPRGRGWIRASVEKQNG